MYSPAEPKVLILCFSDFLFDCDSNFINMFRRIEFRSYLGREKGGRSLSNYIEIKIMAEALEICNQKLPDLAASLSDNGGFPVHRD